MSGSETDTRAIQRILYPTEVPLEDKSALAVASALARQSQALLLIAHVVETSDSGGAAAWSLEAAGNADAVKQLKEVFPSDPAVRYEYRLAAGSPGASILRLAQDEGVDLIVMDTHGRTGLRRLLMGSVAEEVVRGATCPVLTLKRAGPNTTEEMELERILFPTDFSPSAHAAFPLAESLARDTDAELMILHVQPSVMPSGSGPALAHEMLPPTTSELKERLRRMQPSRSRVRCSHHLHSGAPAEEIERFAENQGVDLIVMGTHGRSGMTRLLMGSIAEDVVRRAPCPVITARPAPENEIQ